MSINMTIISLWFLLFMAASLFLYYIIPLRFRWVALLASSIVLFVLASGWETIPYLAYGIIVSFLGAWLIERKSKVPWLKKAVLIITLLLLLSELIALKYLNFFVNTAGLFSKLFHFSFGTFSFSLIAPIGISYYMLSIIGYVLGVYWESYSAQKNPFKYALFTCYFPQMTSGPITKYDEMEAQFFPGQRFDYVGIRSGFQRMLWGYFKKMVVADRLAIFVNAIYADLATYSGAYIAVAVVAFAFQIYCDFSGCMDIVLGASEMFGIKLPENFDTPFFSQNISEFWRRWHITLGVWTKENILYPLLKSRFIQKIGQISRKLFGKKIGKKIPTYLGLAVIWFLIGLWHGGSYKFLFLSGFLPGCYLILSDLLSPSFAKLARLLKINTECFSFRLFRSFRTFIVLCSSWVFVPAQSLQEGFKALSGIVTTNNFWVLTDDSLFAFGLDQKDFLLIVLSFFIVLTVGILHRKGIHIRQALSKQNIAFQWLIMLGAIFAILIFGIYGSGYDPSDFIYGGF